MNIKNAWNDVLYGAKRGLLIGCVVSLAAMVLAGPSASLALQLGCAASAANILLALFGRFVGL